MHILMLMGYCVMNRMGLGKTAPVYESQLILTVHDLANSLDKSNQVDISRKTT